MQAGRVEFLGLRVVQWRYMKLAHLPKQKLNEDLKQIFSRYLDLSKYRLFYFGSRITGGGDERSDIDVGIYGKTPVPDSIVAKIQNDIESLPTLYSIDVVDFSQASDIFQKVALQKTEPIL